jgi:hypothetical protein
VVAVFETEQLKCTRPPLRLRILEGKCMVGNVGIYICTDLAVVCVCVSVDIVEHKHDHQQGAVPMCTSYVGAAVWVYA